MQSLHTFCYGKTRMRFDEFRWLHLNDTELIRTLLNDDSVECTVDEVNRQFLITDVRGEPSQDHLIIMEKTLERILENIQDITKGS